jgi:hypothetical protein
MHFDFSKDMDTWLARAGFKRISERWCVKE